MKHLIKKKTANANEKQNKTNQNKKQENKCENIYSNIQQKSNLIMIIRLIIVWLQMRSIGSVG